MSFCSVFILFFISFISFSTCFVLQSSRAVEEEKRIDDMQTNNKEYTILVMLKPFDKAAFYNLDGGKRSIRVKRTSDLAKFTASKNLSQTKVVQLYLQLYKDLYSTRNNPKPIHPESIKPVLKKFKKKLVTFFFPQSAQDERRR
ncbi:uncharacterized protein LOC113502024 [Trichoplusia ni]|uniref:Uncharacterized protein LOC113502024 n=1 Tax=Trichoplusia ni TaxID=7111 RepID=A0A7E5WEQ6_TRINI|nr:uncharacterized protein LOC113502024 [Trichoplusia ni]